MRANFRGSSSTCVTLLTTFAILILAAIPPGSASVLCIAPGGHVQIEAFNAGCCSHPESEQDQPGGCGFSGTCRNCVDLLVVLDGLNTLSGSNRIMDEASTGPVLVRNLSASLFPPNEVSLAGSGASISALTSLRC